MDAVLPVFVDHHKTIVVFGEVSSESVENEFHDK